MKETSTAVNGEIKGVFKLNLFIISLIFGLFMLGILPVGAGKKISYINPACEFNGNGAVGECSEAEGGYGAFNSYNSIAFNAGEEYLQKKDTVHFGSLVVNASGNSDNPVVFGAYGEGADPVITSRKVIKGDWQDQNGIYIFNTGESIVETFWAWDGNGSWEDAYEVEEDIEMPTYPEAGKWGQSGTSIYYNPSPGQPVPGAESSRFYYSINTALSGVVLEGSYISFSNFRLARSAHHGIKVLGDYNKLENITADHNGNTTSNTAGGLGIGNGIELVGSNNLVSNSSASYNEDHGLVAELMEGLPKPRANVFTGCVSHHNGDNGATLQGGPDGAVEGAFVNCVIYANGEDNDYSSNGIRFIYAEGEITGSKIYDNYGAGIELLIADSGALAEISGNVIQDNNKAGFGYSTYQNSGISISRNYLGTVEISGNTITNSAGSQQDIGVRQYFNGPTGTLKIERNYIYEHEFGIDIEAERGNIDPIVKSNIYSPGTLFMFYYQVCRIDEWNLFDFTVNERLALPSNKKGNSKKFLPAPF